MGRWKMNCIFCKIVNREIPSKIVYEDEKVLVFEDINPQAPLHLLVIPKKHIESVMEISEEDKEIILRIYQAIQKIVKEKNLSGGFRVVVNYGKDAGQTVFHLHFHLLAKRLFGWPPG
jgi:histidine triad (HIT) family protein